MIRSNFEMPRMPDHWGESLDGVSPEEAPENAAGQAPTPTQIQVASALEYDGASRRLTLTRSDGTVQEFPANNNAQRNSRGKWENGTFEYGYQKSHPDDAPNSAYGSYGIQVFKVPGAEGLGVHSGRDGVKDELGRSGVDHATKGCIRTTDDGMAAIRDTISAGDPIRHITVRNNR